MISSAREPCNMLLRRCLKLLFLTFWGSIASQGQTQCAPDVVVGAALGLQRDAAQGYALFLRSLHASAPNASVHLLVDAASHDAVQELARNRLTGLVTLHLQTGDGVPSIAKGLSMQLGRYWLYDTLLDSLLAAYRTHIATGLRCDEPLVLLSDTRDVVFQDDPFARHRTRHARRRSAHSLSRERTAPMPALVTFAEPSFVALAGARACSGQPSLRDAGLVVDDGLWARLPAQPPHDQDALAWNMRVASGFMRPACFAPLARLPVLCSGTTLGTLPSISAYVKAMVSALPFTVSGGRGYFVGADQPLHNLLLYHAASLQQQRKLMASSASGGGDDDSCAEAAGADAAAAVVRGPLADLPLVAPALDAVAASDPAYGALLALSTRLSRTVTVEVVPHEEATVCTLGLWPHNRVPVSGGAGKRTSLVAVHAGGLPMGLGGAYPAAESLPSADAWLGNVTAGPDPHPCPAGGAETSGPAADSELPPPICAVVHQYDRHMQLRKWADVRWGGADPARLYCDTAVARCW